MIHLIQADSYCWYHSHHCWLRPWSRQVPPLVSIDFESYEDILPYTQAEEYESMPRRLCCCAD